MKRICVVILFMAVFIQCHGQLFIGSGGNGSEENPYKIANTDDYVELCEILFNSNTGHQGSVAGQHFELIENLYLPDEIFLPTGMFSFPRFVNCVFDGFLHGHGHTIQYDSITNILDRDYERFLFYGVSGYVDSIVMVGGYCYRASLFGTIKEEGKIHACINRANKYLPDLLSAGIAGTNNGVISFCSNYGDIYAMSDGLSLDAGGICGVNNANAIISNCINYGNMYNVLNSGGICIANGGSIIDCKNFGNIIAAEELPEGIELTEVFGNGGIVCTMQSYNDNSIESLISRCINIGRIDGGKLFMSGGILCGDASINIDSWQYNNQTSRCVIANCANYGNISGLNVIGGIIGEQARQLSIINCLNCGNVEQSNSWGTIAGKVSNLVSISKCLNINMQSQMIGDSIIVSDDVPFDISNNYFDRQMVYDLIQDDTDCSSGVLTIEISGTNNDLQEMLGNGWSYNSNQYPIPEGLENDTLAMLYSCPIYLRVDEESIDNVDSVAHHFCVSNANNVIWSSGSKIIIDETSAIVIGEGYETITATLSDYSFSRTLKLYIPDDDSIPILPSDTVNTEPTDTIVSYDINHSPNFTLNIYPNPVSRLINIESSNTILNVDIFSYSGEKRFTKKILGKTATINLETFENGIYIVVSHFTNGKIASNIIVVQRE